MAVLTYLLPWHLAERKVVCWGSRTLCVPGLSLPLAPTIKKAGCPLTASEEDITLYHGSRITWTNRRGQKVKKGQFTTKL